jgi:hypothetical protein
MLYWECKRRLDLLRQFRRLALDYFNNVRYPDWMSDGGPILNESAQKARVQINRLAEDLVPTLDLLGIGHSVTYTPAPAVGGYIQHIDVVANVFDLWRFQIGPEMVLDCVDRAIGAYERESQKLLHKTFNPVY